MPRKLKTSTFRKTQHKKKPRKSYKKTNAKTYRRKKVVGGVKGENNPDEKSKKATQTDAKHKSFPGIRKIPRSSDLQGDCEKALSKDVHDLAGAFKSSTLKETK